MILADLNKSLSNTLQKKGLLNLNSNLKSHIAQSLYMILADLNKSMDNLSESSLACANPLQPNI